MNLFTRLFTPHSPTIAKHNYIQLHIEAVGVGLFNALSPFLSVLLTRLGATAFQLSLLTSVPALAGFILVIPLGRILQNQKDIVNWYSTNRILYVIAFTLTGICVATLPQSFKVLIILLVWFLVTIPQTILNITFNIVMNGIAGPTGRYELMSRRWIILGGITALFSFAIGQYLGETFSSAKYATAFIGLSIIGGLISYFSSHSYKIDYIQASKDTHQAKSSSVLAVIKDTYLQLKNNPIFTTFLAKRFIVNFGALMVSPLFSIYYVREIATTDSWIAIFSTTSTAITVLGYFFWMRGSRAGNTRKILLWSTFGTSLFPLLTAITHQEILITLYAGINGLFTAGLNLVFFDELLKPIPKESIAIFLSIAQGFSYFATIIAPITGSFLSDKIGISTTILIGGCVQLLGFILFLFTKRIKTHKEIPIQDSGNICKGQDYN